jgi:ribosomal protein S27AE
MENSIVKFEEHINEDEIENEDDGETETPYTIVRSTLEEDEAIAKDPELKNKKVICPDCGKSVMAKTLKFSHKYTCKKTVIKKDDKVIEKPIVKSNTSLHPMVKTRVNKYSHLKLF